ncbi:hypothetical protein [Xanthobacter sediminis]|uniref:hypothetical protein n=1 Tax=Xanthobacter sediminis TaxID=3119926 RepID=UPI0037282F2C
MRTPALAARTLAASGQCRNAAKARPGDITARNATAYYIMVESRKKFSRYLIIACHQTVMTKQGAKQLHIARSTGQ